MTRTKGIGTDRCWCGREWPVDTLKDQCDAGDHIEQQGDTE